MNSLQSNPVVYSNFRAARSALYAGVLVLVVIAVISAVATLRVLRAEALRHATVTTQNLSQTLQRSLEGTIDTIDVSLQVCADEIGRQLRVGNVAPAAMTEFLERQRSRLPGVAYVRATDERGNIVYGPGVVSPPVNQSDREFFALQRDKPDVGLYVEKPLFARINQRWVWPFSRRWSRPDGSFGGVVFASILLDQFEAQLSRVQLDPGGIIVLRDGDLGLIARHPNPANPPVPVGDRRVSDAFARAVLADPMAGSFISDGTTVDRVGRIFSYRRSERYGFVIGVGLSSDEVLGEWRKLAWFVGGAVAALVVALVMAAGLISRAWRRQDRDVALLQASRQAAAKAKESAEAANRAKSEFLASMSHELRTPLNAILGFAQLISSEPELSRETRAGANEIWKAGDHLLSLVNDMIDLARIEAGKLELSVEPVSVKAVLAKCLTMVATLADKQGVEVIDNTDLDETLAVKADAIRLRQVLINFLSNAIKYNRPQGGVVTLFAQKNKGVVRISIADNGPGISAEKQARIFNAFDRLGRETGSAEGAGIGLVITKRLVEAMGGRIGFESVAGEGSTFWVELSVSDIAAAPQPQAVEPRLASGKSTQALTRPVVLYIEDNPMNQRLMQRIFDGQTDLELREADTAERGIEMALAIQPALILMDINLPGINGYEALKLLKADPRTANIAVIALSANAMKGDAQRGLKAGFMDYIVKPIDVRAMHHVLDKVLANRAAKPSSPA